MSRVASWAVRNVHIQVTHEKRHTQESSERTDVANKKGPDVYALGECKKKKGCPFFDPDEIRKAPEEQIAV